LQYLLLSKEGVYWNQETNLEGARGEKLYPHNVVPWLFACTCKLLPHEQIAELKAEEGPEKDHFGLCSAWALLILCNFLARNKNLSLPFEVVGVVCIFSGWDHIWINCGDTYQVSYTLFLVFVIRYS
jgi:hypothetical protein